jgi:hypothetical protein
VGKPASHAAAAKSNTSQNTNVTSKNKNQKKLEEPKPTFKALYPRESVCNAYIINDGRRSLPFTKGSTSKY